jgi:hypothetical protein
LPEPEQLIEGYVFQNGPLREAMVYLDNNANGIHDPDEIFTFTDSAGKYVLNSPQYIASINVVTKESTVDVATGSIAPNLWLSAPVGASVISIFTTILNSSNMNNEELLSVFDMDQGIDLLDYSHHFDDLVDQAVVGAKASALLLNTITTFSNVLSSLNISSNEGFLISLSSVADVLTETAMANGQIDFTDAATITNIQQNIMADIAEVIMEGSQDIPNINVIQTALDSALPSLLASNEVIDISTIDIL